ncbi:hypothetical protein H8959_006698 [Pygathrix nigripes]
MPGCGSHSGICCVPHGLVQGCPALATCIYLLAFLFVSLAWLASGSCPGPPLGPAHSFLSPPAPGACLTLALDRLDRSHGNARAAVDAGMQAGLSRADKRLPPSLPRVMGTCLVPDLHGAIKGGEPRITSSYSQTVPFSRFCTSLAVYSSSSH